MACLTLAFWYDVVVAAIIVIAICAVLRLIVMALGGASGPFWPPQFMPPAGSANSLPHFLAAVLNIIIWAIIALFIAWLIFMLLSCLFGGVGWWPLRFPR